MRLTQYSKIWQYDYNQSKSGVVVLGASRVQHYREKQAKAALICNLQVYIFSLDEIHYTN